MNYSGQNLISDRYPKETDRKKENYVDQCFSGIGVGQFIEDTLIAKIQQIIQSEMAQAIELYMTDFKYPNHIKQESESQHDKYPCFHQQTQESQEDKVKHNHHSQNGINILINSMNVRKQKMESRKKWKINQKMISKQLTMYLSFLSHQIQNKQIRLMNVEEKMSQLAQLCEQMSEQTYERVCEGMEQRWSELIDALSGEMQQSKTDVNVFSDRLIKCESKVCEQTEVIDKYTQDILKKIAGFKRSVLLREEQLIEQTNQMKKLIHSQVLQEMNDKFKRFEDILHLQEGFRNYKAIHQNKQDNLDILGLAKVINQSESHYQFQNLLSKKSSKGNQ